MSAYIINEQNYDFLLSFLREEGANRMFYLYTDIGNGNESVSFSKFHAGYDLHKCEKVIQILINQNYKSVNHRYNANEFPDVYQCDVDFYYPDYLKKTNLKGETVKINKYGAILSMLDCYEYQSCETPDYYTSQACQIVNSLRTHIIRKTSVYEGIDGWFSL